MRVFAKASSWSLLRGAGLAALALTLWLSVGSDAAKAELRYFSTGEITGAGLTTPSDIAVDETSGNVFVADTGNGRIRVFDDGGAGAALVLDFGEAALTSPVGIAVDQSDGDVYVSDAGEGRIVRFQPDDRTNPTAFAEVAFASPAEGGDFAAGEIGSFDSKIAIDPTTGDLLVADTGNIAVSRFSSTGTFLGAFDGSDSSLGTFTSLFDVAVGPTGEIFVIANGLVEDAYDVVSATRLAGFDAAGQVTSSYSVNPDAYTAIAVDQQSGNLVLANGGAAVGGNPREKLRLQIFAGEQQIEEVLFSEPHLRLAGLAVDGRIYGLTRFEVSGGFGPWSMDSIQLIEKRFVPEVTAGDPTAITTESAHLVGTVNTGGETGAEYHFEYSADRGQSWELTPSEPAGSGSSPEAVGADITGLLPGARYEFRLRASSPFGASTSATRTFRTLTVPPLATTTDAVEVHAGDAVATGTVNSLGGQTGYYFEYGPTTAYGSRAPAGNLVPVGDGRAPVQASERLEGLQPGTTYHFRIVAENSIGEVAFGEDVTFTTHASGSGPTRAFELVSPAEKGGNNVKAGLGFGSDEAGDILTYTGVTPLGDLSTEGNPLFPSYIARRSGAGWTSQPTDPPQVAAPPEPSAPGIVIATAAISEDGTKALVISRKALAPGAVDQQGNVYVRDLITGQYTTIFSTTDLGWFYDQVYIHAVVPRMYAGATPNFDHILLLSSSLSTIPGAPGTTFMPGTPPGALFDFTGGELKLVSEAPDGTPIEGSGVGFKEPGKTVISRDGERIIFTSPEALYIREGGETKAISESRRAADPAGTLRYAEQISGDRNLDVVYFVSRDLTDDSPDGQNSLYRYDVESGALDFLSVLEEGPVGQSPPKIQQVSADGSSVYFSSRVPLTADASEGGELGPGSNLYVWRGGVVSFIGALYLDPGSPDTAWASANGRYLAFTSVSNLTGYDPTSPVCVGFEDVGACRQIYRYDAVADELRCVSCPVGTAIGHASIGPKGLEDIGTQFPRAVDDDGDVFFDSPERLLPGDVNSVRDVYEFSDAGGLALISTGHGGESRLAQVSLDGRDVFFTTTDQLVPIDRDRNIDVYDARKGGGIPAQHVEAEAPCIGEACRGSALPPPPPPPAGSETIAGSGNVNARRKGRCAKKRSRAARKACAHKKHRRHRGKSTHVNRTNQDRRQGR